MKKAKLCLFLGLITVPLTNAFAQNICQVNSVGDGIGTSGTLRYCIAQANASPGIGLFIIRFNIPSTGQVAEITAQTEFVITRSNVLIDGYTQPGASLNANPAPLPLNTQLRVSVGVQRSNLFVGHAVFRIEASDVTIRGLNIHSGPVYQVAICATSTTACQNNKIQGNFLGTDPTGSQSRPSGWFAANPPYGAGVYLGGRASNNFIGMDGDGILDVSERNLISGENPPSAVSGFFGHGVLLVGGAAAPSNNSIIGNLIGANAALTGPLGNNWGITILNGVNNTTIRGNVIAGNNNDGIWAGVLQQTPNPVANNGIVVYQNAIGSNPNNNRAIANGQDGIQLYGGNQNVQIGNAGMNGSSNLISGNARNGITVYGAGQATTANNKIEFNVIGLSTDLGSAVPNRVHGIQIIDTIQGTEINRNAISGNGSSGIALYGADSTRIVNNAIGVNPSGSIIPNSDYGLLFYCINDHCTRNASAEQNYIAGNGAAGVALFGAVTNCAIGSSTSDLGNVIRHNQGGGVFVALADTSNQVAGNDISLNEETGVLILGSSARVTQNLINDNTGWGVAIVPYFGSDSSPLSAGDDVIGTPTIANNQINGNGDGGIILQDATLAGAANLGLTNTIGDNDSQPDIAQGWLGAIEILDTSNQPITSGSYRVTATSTTVPYSVTGSVPSGGLWGPAGFDYNDAFKWFFLVSFIVDQNGTFIQFNPYNITVVGPTSGTGSYTFDGVNNDSNHGGKPAGLMTFGQFRYQVAEAITKPDSDQDGVPDESDCAPYDANFPRSAQCDADSDGYCNDQISGRVRQANCPNDASCQNGLCTPTDCDDSRNGVNPGRTEGPFGYRVCGDNLDNDCDRLVDMNDPGCWQCATDDDCQNNTVCDGRETCTNHVCQNGTPLDCNDNNVCTSDSCHPANGCQYVNIDASCNDNDPCTENDHCQNGSCAGDPLDNDNDGYVTVACAGDDCDDNNDTIYPGAQEGPYGHSSCADSKDNDCDTHVDMRDSACWQCATDDDCQNNTVCDGRETCTNHVCQNSMPLDCDDDNVCTSDSCHPTQGCQYTNLDASCNDNAPCTENDHCQNGSCAGDPLDHDNDGYVAAACAGDDCDDNNNNIYPGAQEICGDDIDQDCNGSDLECDCDDADDDGYQDAACGGTDCDDNNKEIHPGAAEVTCNGKDDDCCESGSVVCIIWTPDDADPSDADGDTYTVGCGKDCNDEDDTVHPGAKEICGDGIDQDCNGSDVACDCLDDDGDGYRDKACGGDDCNDHDKNVHPGAQEVCTDNIDNDCDGSTDFVDDDCRRGSSGCGCASSGSSIGALPLLALLTLLRRRRR